MATKKTNSMLPLMKRFDHGTFVHLLYPLLAGIPTAIILLYALDFGDVYQNILDNVISPVITGLVSGGFIYALRGK